MGKLTRPQTALLAFLALHAGEPQPREVLGDQFWPDATVNAARQNLRTSLSALRRELEGPGRAPEGSVILGHGNTLVSLGTTLVRSDVADFDAALRQAVGAQTGGDREGALTAYREAVALYTGPLLPALTEEWVRTERARLAAAHEEALVQIAVLALETGDAEAAYRDALRAVAADPLSVSANGVLIRACRALGKDAEARRLYARAETLFSEKFGATPPALAAALQDAPIPPASEAPRFAVAANPPAPVAAASAPVRLPAVTSSRFVGRESELTAMLSALSDGGGTRLVTLTGAGGSGKTRLALEAARRLASDGAFPGGSYFVSLVDLREAERIPDALAAALALPPRPPQMSAQDQVIAALNEAPGRTLLVLDNLEQLLPDAVEVVAELLGRVANVVCVATSRRSLLLEGEREMPVGPLPVPGGKDDGRIREDRGGPEADYLPPSALMEYAGVQLFADRARGVRPDFQVTPRNAPDVARLCTRLEGIPLALELAASRAQALSPAQMLAQMDAGRSFDLLTAGRRFEMAARHTTLRSVIHWSYDLLPESARRLFARLSVFRGGWTLESAESVCEESTSAFGFSSLLDDLTVLREHSFVLADEPDTEGRGEEELPQMRYRMLETLREFADEQLVETERAELLQRHAVYFAAASPELREIVRAGGGPELKAYLRHIEAEQENLLAALTWVQSSSTAGDSVLDTGYRLLEFLWLFWDTRGRSAEGRRLIQAVLEKDQRFVGGDRPEISDEEASRRAVVLRAAAILAFRQSDFDTAATRAEELRELIAHYPALGGLYAVSALQILGSVATERADYESAVQWLGEALARIPEDDARRRSIALSNLGAVAARAGDLDAARRYYEESLPLKRQGSRDQRSLALTLGNLGGVLAMQNDLEGARACLEEAADLCRDLGDKRGLLITLCNLADLHGDRSDPPAARRSLEEALGLWRECGGEPILLARLLEGGAQLADACKEPHRSVRLYAAAAALRETIGAREAGLNRGRPEHILARHRAALGEAVYERHWAAGAALSPEQAASEVLGAAPT